jgi:hypothetical protein
MKKRYARRAFMLVMVIFLVGLSVTASTLAVRQIGEVNRLADRMTQRAMDRWDAADR